MGLELKEIGPPKVWFPLKKYIVIQVSQSTAINNKQAIFQIAHEVVYVLSPNGHLTANNLEEGLATYFSKIVTDRYSKDKLYATISIQNIKYLKPFEIVKNLLTFDPKQSRNHESFNQKFEAFQKRNS